MSVVADLGVPAGDFALRDALAAAPEVTVEFERVVTHSQEWIMPFLWASGEDLDRFDRAMHDDGTVARVSLANDFGQIRLYQIRWSDDVKGIVNTIFDREGTLVEAVARENRWELKVRFGSHAGLSTLQSHFERADVAFTVQRVYTPSQPRQPEFDVTPGQRSALVGALEGGYFDVPRGTTMSDLADELDVSTNALSERLRRGTANLVRTTLTVRDSVGVEDHDGADPD